MGHVPEYRVELLGVRVRGRDVVRSVEVPLTPGLNALVGLNGVGKSRLLEAVRRALTGEGTPGFTTHLLFRRTVGDPESSTEWLTPRFLESPDEDEGSATQRRRLSARIRRLYEEEVAGLLERLERLDKQRQEFISAAGFSPDVATALRQAQKGGPLVFPGFDQLVDQGLLCWVQEDSSTPVLWAAVDPSVEGTRVLLDRLSQEWSEARDRYDADYDVAQEDQGGEVFGEYPYWQFGMEFNYLPGEADPASGLLLPVPIVPIGEEPRERRPTVVGDTFDLSAAQTYVKHRLSLDLDWTSLLAGALKDQISDSDSEADTEDNELLGYLENIYTGGSWPPVALDSVSARANEIYGWLYPAPPELRCEFRPIREWLTKEPIRWQARDTGSGAWVPPQCLSRSQFRWARLAVSLAAENASDLGSYAVFDEPESGIHRLADLQLGRALRRITVNPGTTVLVATHSPLIAAEADNLIEVTRDEAGDVLASRVTEHFFDRAEQLGMLPQDVLGSARQVLLVEGPHDRQVVESLLSETLSATRTLVLPFGGVTERGQAINAGLLTRFGPRRLIIMVDGLGPEAEIRWTQASERAESGATEEARGVLDAYGKKPVEALFLRTAGHELLAAGRLGDCTVVALSAPDVLDLLRWDHFCSKRSLTELRTEFASKDRQGLSFKEWASRAYGAKYDPGRIDRALAEMDHLPTDISRLDTALREVLQPQVVGDLFES